MQKVGLGIWWCLDGPSAYHARATCSTFWMEEKTPRTRGQWEWVALRLVCLFCFLNIRTKSSPKSTIRREISTYIHLFWAFYQRAPWGGGKRKREETSRMTPLPKTGFGTPIVWYVVQPPSGVAALFVLAKKAEDWPDQTLFSQRKTKGQQLKGKIVSEFFTLFHNFSHFFIIFPPGLSPSKQRALAQGEQKRRKDNKRKRANRFCTLVVARLSSSNFRGMQKFSGGCVVRYIFLPPCVLQPLMSWPNFIWCNQLQCITEI